MNESISNPNTTHIPKCDCPAPIRNIDHGDTIA